MYFPRTKEKMMENGARVLKSDWSAQSSDTIIGLVTRRLNLERIHQKIVVFHLRRVKGIPENIATNPTHHLKVEITGV